MWRMNYDAERHGTPDGIGRKLDDILECRDEGRVTGNRTGRGQRDQPDQGDIYTTQQSCTTHLTRRAT